MESPDTWSHAFEALAVPRRQQLLLALEQTPNGTALDPFTELSDDFTGNGRHAVSLVHEDLPKLHEMGFIEWDREAECVTRGPAFDHLGPLLDVIREHGLADDNVG